MDTSAMTKFARRAGQQGFSLVELMVTMVVMFIVFGVVFRSANMFQQRGQA
jgi:prepilin-type N-terminal cleavage/methylation domain-containing protein